MTTDRSTPRPTPPSTPGPAGPGPRATLPAHGLRAVWAAPAIALAAALAACAGLEAEPVGGPAATAPAATTASDSLTQVTVRAVSHDAKVIGSNVGGARITIEDAETGAVLARGVQEGSTGSTRLLVVEPRQRGEPVFAADGAAGFTAELALDRPTRVRIVAEAPLGTPHAMQRSSKTLLLVPGVDITGEGVIVELNGFTVEIEDPPARVGAGDTVPVRARVTMLCGCPIEPGGLWDADRLRIVARLVRDGTIVAEGRLAYAGETSVFEGSLTAPGAGAAELQVIALDPERANTGIARAPVVVR